jgi:hypothetical protein
VQEPTTHHNTTCHSGCSNRLWGPDRSACAFLHLFVCTRPPFAKQTWNQTLVLTEKYLVSNSTHRHRNWALVLDIPVLVCGNCLLDIAVCSHNRDRGFRQASGKAADVTPQRELLSVKAGISTVTGLTAVHCVPCGQTEE